VRFDYVAMIKKENRISGLGRLKMTVPNVTKGTATM
jgi:hypothetical protein